MWPFGKRKKARFVDEEALARSLASQTDVVGVVDALEAAGMPPNATLQVEYFFYADVESNGQALARELHTRGYSTECRPAADGGPLFCITGWTIPLVINREWLASWAADMVRLGFRHDCEFDGWGTYPAGSASES